MHLSLNQTLTEEIVRDCFILPGAASPLSWFSWPPHSRLSSDAVAEGPASRPASLATEGLESVR